MLTGPVVRSKHEVFLDPVLHLRFHSKVSALTCDPRAVAANPDAVFIMDSRLRYQQPSGLPISVDFPNPILKRYFHYGCPLGKARMEI